MADKVTAWRGINGQLFETEEAAKAAELRAAAAWLADANCEHLVNVCTGKTDCSRSAEYIGLLWRELRATKERMAKATP